MGRETKTKKKKKKICNKTKNFDIAFLFIWHQFLTHHNLPFIINNCPMEIYCTFFQVSGKAFFKHIFQIVLVYLLLQWSFTHTHTRTHTKLSYFNNHIKKKCIHSHIKKCSSRIHLANIFPGLFLKHFLLV